MGQIDSNQKYEYRSPPGRNTLAADPGTASELLKKHTEIFLTAKNFMRIFVQKQAHLVTTHK